jgi:hypothetical protein
MKACPTQAGEPFANLPTAEEYCLIEYLFARLLNHPGP